MTPANTKHGTTTTCGRPDPSQSNSATASSTCTSCVNCHRSNPAIASIQRPRARLPELPCHAPPQATRPLHRLAKAIHPPTGDSDLRRYAAQLGLDVAAFDRDRGSIEVADRIRRDVDSGLASGQVVGTPTLFIDGVVHRGGYDPPTLLAALAP